MTMRTLNYFIEHEVFDAELGLETWTVYCGVTLHYPYGDVAGKDEYQMSCGSREEAERLVETLHRSHG